VSKFWSKAETKGIYKRKRASHRFTPTDELIDQFIDHYLFWPARDNIQLKCKSGFWA